MGEDLPAEIATLVTLARGARVRIAAVAGAAARDETGRTYAGATVDLPSLTVSAVELAVAQAVAAGARGLEAVAVVGDPPSAADLQAVRDLGGHGVPVLSCSAEGAVIDRLVT